MYHSLSAAVPCPNCGEHTLDIIESRPSGESRRRRKLCRSCGHRLGTREVSETWYAQALCDRALLDRIRADLGLAAPPLTAAPAQDADPCLDCIHRIRATCDLGFPEFGTKEALDCSAMRRRGMT
jgi:ribosomal protein L32